MPADSIPSDFFKNIWIMTVSRVGVSIVARLLKPVIENLLGGLDNGSHSNSIVIHEFFWFPTMWDFTNGEFIDSHIFRCNSTENGIAKTSMGVVIFNREDSTLRWRGRCPARYFDQSGTML